MVKKKEYNPYAICRAMANRYGGSEDKYLRCVEQVKAKNQYRMREETNRRLAPLIVNRPRESRKKREPKTIMERIRNIFKNL